MRNFVMFCRTAAPLFVVATGVVLVDNVIDVASTWLSFLLATGVALIVTCVDTIIRKGVR